LDAIEDTEVHQDVQRVEQLRDSVYFHTPRRPSPRIVPLCCTAAPTTAPNHRTWCGISFPTRWSHGHASARSRDRAHPAPATSLQPSSGCCFESRQPASRRFPRSTARVLCRCCANARLTSFGCPWRDRQQGFVLVHDTTVQWGPRGVHQAAQLVAHRIRARLCSPSSGPPHTREFEQ